MMPNVETIRAGRFDVPLVRIGGTPHDCGRQYGAAMSSLIHDTLDAYLESFQQMHGIDRAAVFDLAQKFRPAIEGYAPEILEEMEGLAKGCGLPLAAILTINARSELVHGLKAELASDGCTSFAVLPGATAGGHVLIGQNWDWNPAIRRSTVILDIARRGSPRVLSVAEAGLVGKIGFNEAGIASVINFLLSDQRRFGTPVHVIRRKVLDSETLPEAVGAVVRAERALAANYLIAHGEGAALNIEAWPDDVAIIHPEDDIITHANHFRHLAPGRRDLGKSIFPDSLIRDHHLYRRLRQVSPAPVTVEHCKEFLSDHFGHPDSICRHQNPKAQAGSRIETLGSVVMDVTARTMHFCSGPPCSGSFARVCMDEAAPAVTAAI